MEALNTTLVVRGIISEDDPPINRISWYLSEAWINLPALINSKALKKACAIK